MTLKEKYKDYFQIGAAVSGETLKKHGALISAHFNSITCTNSMKFSSVRPTVNKTNFNEADEIAAYAKEHNMSLRGHTLVWHNQTPDWVFESANREILLHRMKEHIHIMADRYREVATCWDVVNEAIDDKNNFILRPSKWTTIIGEDFIEEAFREAKKALPKTDLFYNDYNETDPIKSKKIYEYIKNLKQNDVPIDGIGMQAHYSIVHPALDELKRAIELYASLGVKIHITEMDVSMFHFEDHSRMDAPTTEMVREQVRAYKEFFEVFRYYKDVIESVSLWGVTDETSWLNYFPVFERKNWPLLFHDDERPKEAYYSIMDF